VKGVDRDILPVPIHKSGSLAMFKPTFILTFTPWNSGSQYMLPYNNGIPNKVNV